jgi:hypothetical protein
VRDLLNAFWLLNLCADGLLALIVIVLWDDYRLAHDQSSVRRLQLFSQNECWQGSDGLRIASASQQIDASRKHTPGSEPAMDKKAKKKTDVLNQRLQKLRQQLAGARKQMDEPGEVARLENEIGQVESELKRLKE